MSITASTEELPAPVLLIPGVGNSGPNHWQTRWEGQFRSCRRVEQRDWDNPICQEWLERLDQDIRATGPRSVIVAHSLGCLLVAHWAAHFSGKVLGALLVAVPDPHGRNFPAQARGFAPLPKGPLPFPSIVVASTDDPYADLQFAQACACSWGSQLIDVGAKGHLNADSGLDDWRDGQVLLRELIDSSALRAAERASRG
jgi:predicted alpha/beta hydrolase family esterase